MSGIKGKPLSAEHKAKVSMSMKGKNKGRKFTAEHKAKLSEARKKFLANPENHNSWKGEKASYRAIHAFIVRKYGKAKKCEKCENEKRIHWSNIDHKYQRDRKNWKQLCAKCHGAFDKLQKLRKQKNVLE